MINLELLNKFSHESLRYKENINVLYYTLNNFSGSEGVDIHLTFNNGGGEFVSKGRYEDWLQSRREEKIAQILN
jgi:hypothetical protein